MNKCNLIDLQKGGKNETILGHEKLRSGGEPTATRTTHGGDDGGENPGETPGSGVHKMHRGHNLSFIIHFKL